RSKSFPASNRCFMRYTIRRRLRYLLHPGSGFISIFEHDLRANAFAFVARENRLPPRITCGAGFSGSCSSEGFRSLPRERTGVWTSGLTKAHAERAPVAAANVDRRRGVLHQHEIAATHVAPIGLQQKRLGVRRHLLPRPILEQPPVAAIGVVPDRIGSLRQAIVRIVGGKIAALGPRHAEYDGGIGLLQRILDGGRG